MDKFPAPPATWDRLPSGRRTLAVDPYESWPPKDAAGLHLLNGWQFQQKLLLHISKPPGAQAALSMRLGRAPAIEHLYGRQSAGRLLSLRPKLLGAPGRAAAAYERLGQSSGFDLLWITFSAGHFAGHYYWNPTAVIDGEVEDHERRDLERTVEDAYSAVDDAIGRVLEALPADADVIAFSPIGMGPETSRSDLLPALLRAVLSGPGPGDDAGAEPDETPGGLIWRLRARMPMGWRLALARPLPRAAVRGLTSAMHLRGTDWATTRAFALPGDHAGYVRLNIRGREREGIVDAADAPALMDEIEAGLLSFRDPDGSPSVDGVERVADQISGSRTEHLPDLVVRWPDRPSTGLAGVSSPDHGEIARAGVGTGRTGNHTTHGWAVLAPGASRVRDLGRAPRLTDIPATACALLDGDAAGLRGESVFESP
jgi:hypothetical protein